MKYYNNDGEYIGEFDGEKFNGILPIYEEMFDIIVTSHMLHNTSGSIPIKGMTMLLMDHGFISHDIKFAHLYDGNPVIA